jgi:hypothetical protein
MVADLSLATTRHTVRRAWLVLTIAFTAFAVLLTSAGTGAYIYHRSAMQQREGRLETSGEVLLQPRNETKFKQVRDGEVVREGDIIKVQSGMQARLVFFDGSALQLAEESQVLIEELQSSRFVDAEKRIRLSQRQGWTRLTVAPATDYRLGRFTVQLEGMEVETQSRPGEGAEISFELRPYVEALGEPVKPPPQEARVAVYAGSARVWAGGDEVLLNAGQVTALTPGGPLMPPAALPHELIRNGDFTQLAVHGDEVRPSWWLITADQGGDFGNLWGKTELTYREIDGELAPVVVFERRLNAKDNAVHGIQQPLDLPLSHFRKLRLRVTFQVRYHSLSGGGIKDSEYPIIIKVTYRDRQNRSIAWYRGFYTHNEAKLPVDNGIQVPQGEWYTFSQDLLQLTSKRNEPEPVYLETLDIYASGHDFESAVAKVSIEGE